LGTGSVLGMLIAIAAGLLVWRNWTTPTALEGRYWVFGLIVLAEAVLIGVGCIFLARRGLTRWYGWWIGICVALHFIPLAWIFEDWSYLVLAVVQVAGLVTMFPPLKRGTYATSRWACPWIALTFLVFAIASGIILLLRYGYLVLGSPVPLYVQDGYYDFNQLSISVSHKTADDCVRVVVSSPVCRDRL